MTTMLIAMNETRETGSFMGDQLCSLKAAYLFAENTPGVDRIIMSCSPGNEMQFLWTKFIEKYGVEVVWDSYDPGNWSARLGAWDSWRAARSIEGRPFDHYRELYLRIHGAVRQNELCGTERGLGRRNIYEYWWFGQEDAPDEPPRDVGEWDNLGVHTQYSFGADLIHHPPHTPVRDVYISPLAKTQGNVTFTFDFWSDVVHMLVDAGVSVTVGYNNPFCEDLNGSVLYRKHWGDHQLWMEEVCRHKLVACGNTGTGWLAAACGVPMITMEPPNSQMPDHRYRECGLRNLVEVVDEPSVEYVVRRIVEYVQRRVVMTTGCYDILHAGHIRHLEKSRSLGTKLVVALNSDSSVKKLKGNERPINPQDQRKAVLEALRCVDEVRVFDGMDARDLIREVHPDVLTCGHGYSQEMVIGRDLVEGYGGRVVVTYHGDARHEPSTTKIYRRVRAANVTEICRIASGASCNPFDKLRVVADLLLSVREVPGDVVDVGTCEGGSGYVLRRVAPDRELFLCDTWEGNPYDDELCHHKRGEWRASIEYCQKFIGNGDSTHYLKGIFPQSAEGLLDGRQFCFAYVDVDTYYATCGAIEYLWPRMSPGGKMVIDDYQWPPCAGVEKAVQEKFERGQLEVVGNTCIVEKR
jgi:D-glycero-beta-D-manno-heptose 1-phosphate adenylyltransferase